MGIIASLAGIGLLAYNHYICTLDSTMLLFAYGLVIVGALFFLLVERG